MSRKHLNRYVSEFPGRNNQRESDTLGTIAQMTTTAANTNSERLEDQVAEALAIQPTLRSVDRGGLDGLIGKVHNTDCIQLMKAIDDNCINMIFADPPFNLNKKYQSYADQLPFDEYVAWTEKWLREAARILTYDGSLFVYNIPKLLIHTAPILNELLEFRHWIAWNANGKPLGKTLQPSHYGILFYTKTRNNKFYDIRTPHATCRKCDAYLKDYGGKAHLRHPNGYQISDVWNDIHRARHNRRRIKGHPCQLPVHLIERLILMTTDENDIVLDPFCGGGSAGIAAKQMGRKYIGVDIDADYCNQATLRIQEAEQTKQNGIFQSIHLNKAVSVRSIDIE